MFFYLEGTLSHTEPYVAVVDCGGVGYMCHVSTMTLAKIKLGSRCRLYTHLNVREDTFDLYGFADVEEKNCFLLLTGISGVGMKVGLSILSTLTPERFAMSVISADERTLTTCPGVGKKLAQRIILELKDKLKSQSFGEDPVSVNIRSGGTAYEDAVDALMVLGYSRTDAISGVNRVSGEHSLEEVITLALKNLSKI